MIGKQINLEKNRFAMCQISGAHGKVLFSVKENFELKLIKCLPCVRQVAHGELISSLCAEIQDT